MCVREVYHGSVAPIHYLLPSLLSERVGSDFFRRVSRVRSSRGLYRHEQEHVSHHNSPVFKIRVRSYH